MAKSNLGSLSTTLFSLATLIAIVMGVGTAIGATWANNVWLSVLLVVIGLIVGFYSVTQKEVTPYLVGTLTLIVANSAVKLTILDAVLRPVGTFLTAALGNFIIVAGAAALVVSFRAVYGIAK